MKIEPKLQQWINARKRHDLSHAPVDVLSIEAYAQRRVAKKLEKKAKKAERPAAAAADDTMREQTED